MTLILKLELDMVKMYQNTKNEVSMSRHSKDTHTQYENITFPHRQVVINANTHTKYEVSMTMWAGEQIKEKYQKICHLKNTSQND